ncbi:MAG: squalene/phytoene synthase family protein [Elusimicrobiota bacterium]|jgi:phytoene synthase|nr:squalene/phytoene synthase family protein [Elusimicrobiota bacterium]
MDNAYKKSSFASAFFFLPRREREALSAVYAFCRTADDIVDDGHKNAQERLNALRGELDNIYANAPQTKPGKALRQALKNYPVPKRYFSDLLDGMQRDLQTPVRYATLQDLEWYLYRAAGVVGLMCIEIFGYKNPQSRQYAAALGSAVQLTNIARDIGQDAKINRIYLPKEYLQKFNVSEREILTLRDNKNTRALARCFAQLAQERYNKARALLPKEDFAALFPARVMGNVYEALLKKFLTGTCAINGKKLKLNKLQKIITLLKTRGERP